LRQQPPSDAQHRRQQRQRGSQPRGSPDTGTTDGAAVERKPAERRQPLRTAGDVHSGRTVLPDTPPPSPLPPRNEGNHNSPHPTSSSPCPRPRILTRRRKLATRPPSRPTVRLQHPAADCAAGCMTRVATPPPPPPDVTRGNTALGGHCRGGRTQKALQRHNRRPHATTHTMNRQTKTAVSSRGNGSGRNRRNDLHQRNLVGRSHAAPNSWLSHLPICTSDCGDLPAQNATNGARKGDRTIHGRNRASTCCCGMQSDGVPHFAPPTPQCRPESRTRDAKFSAQI